MENNNVNVKNALDIFLEDINGIELVINKLETKSNVSVFEKLCANCESAFNKIASIEVKSIVEAGLSRDVINALTRFRSILVRLKEYKANLISYIEMTSQMENNINTNTNEQKVTPIGETPTVDNKKILSFTPDFKEAA